MDNSKFWANVFKTESDDCWPWLASLDGKGYGQYWFNGKMQRSHRVSWMISNGPIPEGMCILHKCDNPICCRPSHLFIGTRKENSQDMANKGRQRGPKGETHKWTKLKIYEVQQIRRLHNSGEWTIRELSNEYGVSIGAITRIVKRTAWKHI